MQCLLLDDYDIPENDTKIFKFKIFLLYKYIICLEHQKIMESDWSLLCVVGGGYVPRVGAHYSDRGGLPTKVPADCSPAWSETHHQVTIYYPINILL